MDRFRFSGVFMGLLAVAVLITLFIMVINKVEGTSNTKLLPTTTTPTVVPTGSSQ